MREPRKKSVERKCTVEDCDIKHFAFGYCRKHHARFKRNGSVQSIYQLDISDTGCDVKDVRPGARGNLGVNLVNDIKFKAKKRGKDWNLDNATAFKLITSPCRYCSSTPDWPKERVGIDRVDNSIGYEPSNCVPCCTTCNSAKGTMSVVEFKNWIERLYKNMVK